MAANFVGASDLNSLSELPKKCANEAKLDDEFNKLILEYGLDFDELSECLDRTKECGEGLVHLSCPHYPECDADDYCGCTPRDFQERLQASKAVKLVDKAILGHGIDLLGRVCCDSGEQFSLKKSC